LTSRRRRRLAPTGRKRIAQVVGALASVVGLLVAITSLVDWFSKTLDDPEPTPAQQIDARIAAVALRDHALTLGDYLISIRELGLLRQLTASERGEPGFVFAVRVRLRGGLEEKFPLLWTLHRARTGERLDDPIFNQPARTTFTPRARDHARTWPIWCPHPPNPGSFFLRVTLTDEEGLPVDERDSEPVRFAGLPNRLD
jgi:hypothetical protein